MTANEHKGKFIDIVAPDGSIIYYCRKADIYCKMCRRNAKKTYCRYYVEQGLEEHSINVDSLRKCPKVFKEIWDKTHVK